MSIHDPREWDEEYLLNLPVGEFDWLEVKGRRGLDLTDDYVKEPDVKKNISKALSAFANTGGGTLVLGLCDPETEWEVDEGGIPRDIKGGTREWLEDVIPTLTDLPLDDFNVYKILPIGNESQIDEDKAVYVVDIAATADQHRIRPTIIVTTQGLEESRDQSVTGLFLILQTAASTRLSTCSLR